MEGERLQMEREKLETQIEFTKLGKPDKENTGHFLASREVRSFAELEGR